MAWWQRTHKPSADVVAGLRLESGERVLASTYDRADRCHVGTDRALYLAADDGHRRVLWQHIDRAVWERDEERLVVIEVADFGAVQPRSELDLKEPGRLLELIRDRVTASVLLTRHVPVTGSLGMKVVARRNPAGVGEIAWSFWLDTGLDPADPAVQAAVDTGLEEARRELGESGFASDGPPC